MRFSALSSTLCFLALLLSVLLVVPVRASECHGHPSPNAQPNLNPITFPTPTFVRSVTNGALYTIPVDSLTIPIVHLWGSPYEKGYAHGSLMKESVQEFIPAFWAYLENEVVGALNRTGLHIPPAVEEEIANLSLGVLLDLTSNWTAPYTGAHFFEEMQGLADGSGVDLQTLTRIHMIGELTKGSCSMFGIWGPALQAASGLLTMRALDWDMDGPFQSFHQLTIYHAAPNSAEVDFLNVGWSGWIGSISGVNAAGLSIHEIGVFFPDASFGDESRQGVPFTYILRDILQFDSHRLDALSRLAQATRTCNLILGVGDGKDNLFNGVAYSHSSCQIMDDSNMKPVASWHPTINHTTYWGMDWLCPGFNSVLGQQIGNFWGTISPAVAVKSILPIVQTGSLHAYVADLTNMQFYVSFAIHPPTGVKAQYTQFQSPAAVPVPVPVPVPSNSAGVNAYERAFAQVDLKSVFAVEQP